MNITNRLSDCERRLREMGCGELADLAARQMARPHAFLLKRTTRDFEEVCARLEHETALLRTANINDAEIMAINGRVG